MQVEALPVAVVVTVKLRAPHQEVDEILEVGCARQRQLLMDRVASHRAVGGLDFTGKRSKVIALLVRRNFVMKSRNYAKERMTHHYKLIFIKGLSENKDSYCLSLNLDSLKFISKTTKFT